MPLVEKQVCFKLGMFLLSLELNSLPKFITHFSPSDPTKFTSRFQIQLKLSNFTISLSEGYKKDFKLNQMVPKCV